MPPARSRDAHRRHNDCRDCLRKTGLNAAFLFLITVSVLAPHRALAPRHGACGWAPCCCRDRAGGSDSRCGTVELRRLAATLQHHASCVFRRVGMSVHLSDPAYGHDHNFVRLAGRQLHSCRFEPRQCGCWNDARTSRQPFGNKILLNE